MSYAAGASGAPFFGVIVYNGQAPLAQFGVNAATGTVVVGSGGAATQVPAVAVPATFYSYQIQLNYSTGNYTVGMAPDGSSAYSTLGTYSFVAGTFTDADIDSSALSASTFSGTADFDNYTVATPVPEPGAASLAVVGAGGMLLGRKSRRPATS